jgi:hypothetical protein
MLSDYFFYISDQLKFDAEENIDKNARKKRIVNFLVLPAELEKLIVFGYFICLDSLLTILTTFPLRVFYILRDFVIKGKKSISSAKKVEILKFLLFLGGCCLSQILDVSRLYHSIRGQAAIKLYVIFNVLEVLTN